MRCRQDAALCLYRVAQEALNNVARHARATAVEVLSAATAGGCRLEVRDDGVGFDPQALRAGPRLGHASMRERVKLVGGTSPSTAPRARGTTVAAWVPLRGRTS